MCSRRRRPGPQGRRPRLNVGRTNGALGRRQHASENGQQRGLAAPGRPHQQRKFAAVERQAHALERRDLGGAAAEVLRISTASITGSVIA